MSLHEGGEGFAAISKRLGLAESYVRQVINMLGSTSDKSNWKRDAAAASRSLADAIGRHFLTLPQAVVRPAPPPVVRPPVLADTSPPVAWSRDPCPRCGVRGDVGCAHQRPFQPAAGEA